jgi:hypothetical protein
MTQTRSEILIEKLINNSLTPEELDELLGSLKGHDEEYSEILRKYFDSLFNTSASDEE